MSASGSLATLSAGTATVSDHERPFKGSLALAVDQEPVFDLPILSLHFAVTGEATQLGQFTGALQLHIDISHEEQGTETSTGKIVLNAADGDTVTGTVSGTATVAGQDERIVETVTITGGTGRFAGATGTFVITRESALPGCSTEQSITETASQNRRWFGGEAPGHTPAVDEFAVGITDHPERPVVAVRARQNAPATTTTVRTGTPGRANPERSLTQCGRESNYRWLRDVRCRPRLKRATRKRNESLEGYGCGGAQPSGFGVLLDCGQTRRRLTTPPLEARPANSDCWTSEPRRHQRHALVNVPASTDGRAPMAPFGSPGAQARATARQPGAIVSKLLTA